MFFGAAQSVRLATGKSTQSATRLFEPNAKEAPDSSQSRTPAAMEKALDRRKQDLVGQQPNQDNDQHHADHLIHGVEFASIMQEMAEPETSQDRYVNLSRHERSPGKCPTLFHPADEIRQRGWQNDLRPFVQAS